MVGSRSLWVADGGAEKCSCRLLECWVADGGAVFLGIQLQVPKRIVTVVSRWQLISDGGGACVFGGCNCKVLVAM